MSDILFNALSDQELMHYGVLGQKWGKRRYQNYDGTLTDEGHVHYARKDRKKETMLRRGVAASKRELKDAAKIANPYKKQYDTGMNYVNRLLDNKTYNKKMDEFLEQETDKSKPFVDRLIAAVNRLNMASGSSGWIINI